MHEMAVCKVLLGEVGRIAAEQKAAAVTCIELVIGRLAGVEPTLLRSAFGVARAGTAAADAELRIREVPVQVRCTICSEVSEVEPNRLVCPCCGHWKVRLLAGDELLLERLQLGRPAMPALQPEAVAAVHSQ